MTRAYTMQPYFFDNEDVRLYWYDLIDSASWVLAFSTLYLVCRFIYRGRWYRLFCIILAIFFWGAFWNFYDEYKGVNEAIHISEYILFGLVVIHGLYELYLISNVKFIMTIIGGVLGALIVTSVHIQPVYEICFVAAFSVMWFRVTDILVNMDSKTLTALMKKAFWGAIDSFRINKKSDEEN